MSHVYNLITKHRRDKGWSLDQLASRINLTRQAVSAWKKTGVPSNRIFELMKVLEIPSVEITNALADDIMGEVNDRRSNKNSDH